MLVLERNFETFNKLRLLVSEENYDLRIYALRSIFPSLKRDQ